jgi:hypothetical protein
MLMTQSVPPADKPLPRKATLLQVAKAVFWSFLGIRRRSAHEHDVVSLTPLQVVIAGIIGAIILILSLLAFVKFITS